MKQRALEKANERLASANTAISDLTACVVFSSFKGRWYNFLVASHSIYTVLEQGAKDNQKSMKWFSTVNQRRKQDELLNYVYQARNDEEHGLESSIELSGGKIEIKFDTTKPETFPRIGRIQMVDGNLIINDPRRADGSPLEMDVVRPFAKLVKVSVRGVTYAPPESHDNMTLENRSPINVARLALVHYKAILSEATSLGKT